ncbi:hypothetical protein RIB2604_02601920 [Aspergillus luchuensis]|uniref:Uncharacterized protein n=1 Tax=Aspergillus kawachii TaxID=1069201 RepID=A0A146FRX2_ASPKA|nr:hypothetical protein RIB2604_02601920 [Aspergillus luchuensis]
MVVPETHDRVPIGPSANDVKKGDPFFSYATKSIPGQDKGLMVIMPSPVGLQEFLEEVGQYENQHGSSLQSMEWVFTGPPTVPTTTTSTCCSWLVQPLKRHHPLQAVELKIPSHSSH